jgi:shikimate dehydrogenase
VQRVVLIGFRGSGKTAVGKTLATFLRLPFIDTDLLIEHQAGMKIPDIFEHFGEKWFRQLEKEAIASLPREECVVSTGGGAVIDPENVRHLRRDSTVFYLQAPQDVLLHRIAGSSRPRLTNLTQDEEIASLLKERLPLYISAADYCVDSGTLSIDEVCWSIESILASGTVGPDQRKRGAGYFRAMELPANEKTAILRLLGKGENPTTRICGIAGNPCGHSISPLLYNRLFALFHLNYHFTRFQDADIATIIGHARMLDVKGMAVTIPFKASVIPLLDEVDEHAQSIGAVNTVVQCGGKMFGYNTDWIGVQRPLEGHTGDRAVVLGAGGAAAAAVYALLNMGYEVTILNRTAERARIMAERFACGWGGLEAFDGAITDVVVNATPVGMGADNRSLLTAEQLHEGMTVFDLVYTPRTTPLLREAAKAGCREIPGIEMFIHQACAQFRILTGIAVDTDQVREAVA